MSDLLWLAHAVVYLAFGVLAVSNFEVIIVLILILLLSAGALCAFIVGSALAIALLLCMMSFILLLALAFGLGMMSGPSFVGDCGTFNGGAELWAAVCLYFYACFGILGIFGGKFSLFLPAIGGNCKVLLPWVICLDSTGECLD